MGSMGKLWVSFKRTHEQTHQLFFERNPRVLSQSCSKCAHNEPEPLIKSSFEMCSEIFPEHCHAPGIFRLSFSTSSSPDLPSFLLFKTSSRHSGTRQDKQNGLDCGPNTGYCYKSTELVTTCCYCPRNPTHHWCPRPYPHHHRTANGPSYKPWLTHPPASAPPSEDGLLPSNGRREQGYLIPWVEEQGSRAQHR